MFGQSQPDPRKDPPFSSEANRLLFISVGLEGLAIVGGILIGGTFVPTFATCIFVVLIICGLKPTWFCEHVDAQPIAGIPYQRRVSLRAWSIAVAASLLLSAGITGVLALFIPNSPSLSDVIADKVVSRIAALLESKITGSSGPKDELKTALLPTPPKKEVLKDTGRLPSSSLVFSLVRLGPANTLMISERALNSDQSFYRFQMRNEGGDLSDIKVALDLPAPLADKPFVIDHGSADIALLKTVFTGHRELSDEGSRRISGLSNAVVIELSRFLEGGFVDVGIITVPSKTAHVIFATAPDGSIVMGISPIYGRYGSVSVKPRGHRTLPAISQSYPIGYPAEDTELIDMTKPLRPWSRSVLGLVSQSEVLDAQRRRMTIEFEQRFE